MKTLFPVRLPALLPALLVGCLASGTLHAADLLSVYRDALGNDAQFAAARSALDAGRERLVQGRSGLLPSIGLGGSSIWNEVDTTLRRTGVDSSAHYNSNNWQVSLTQPLFRWQNWVAYSQAELAVAQAETQFSAAKMDLIVRVAQAYFDVLLAQDGLATAQTQKTAIAEQLESAKRNFEVGTATITDTHEAQARYDLVTAQEIAAGSDLVVKRHALQSLIGKEPETLKRLRAGVALSAPQPADIGKWVEMAETGSATVQIYQGAYEIAAPRNRTAACRTLPDGRPGGNAGQQQPELQQQLWFGNRQCHDHDRRAVCHSDLCRRGDLVEKS